MTKDDHMAVFGWRHIYTLQPGENWRQLPNGDLIVTHAEREPKIVHPDGTEEPLKP